MPTTTATLAIPAQQSSYAIERIHLDNIRVTAGSSFTYELPAVTDGVIVVKYTLR